MNTERAFAPYLAPRMIFDANLSPEIIEFMFIDVQGRFTQSGKMSPVWGLGAVKTEKPISIIPTNLPALFIGATSGLLKRESSGLYRPNSERHRIRCLSDVGWRQ